MQISVTDNASVSFAHLDFATKQAEGSIKECRFMLASVRIIRKLMLTRIYPKRKNLSRHSVANLWIEGLTIKNMLRSKIWRFWLNAHEFNSFTAQHWHASHLWHKQHRYSRRCLRRCLLCLDTNGLGLFVLTCPFPRMLGKLLWFEVPYPKLFLKYIEIIRDYTKTIGKFIWLLR